MGERVPMQLVDDEMSGLKATAPTPTAPVDDVEVKVSTPLLTALKATGLYVDAEFGYEFTLSRLTGGSAEIETDTVAIQDGGLDVISGSEQPRPGIDLQVESASRFRRRVRSVVGRCNV